MSESQASGSSLVNAHLSYPSNDISTIAPIASSSSQHRPLLQDRLYVGNLHHSVDEYALVQAFSKFGKISQLDFLFHKTGALKGKPRGYAFVQYANKDDALKALTMANDKLLRGRKLVVTYAHQAPLDQGGGGISFNGSKVRKGITEAGRPTALSLLKSSGGSGARSDGTKNKIAMMEAKLKQMKKKVAPTPLSTHSSLPSNTPALDPRSSSLLSRSKPLVSPSESLSGQTIFPRYNEPHGHRSDQKSPPSVSGAK